MFHNLDVSFHNFPTVQLLTAQNKCGLRTGQKLCGLFPCRVDLVLVSGDIANMTMDVDDKASAEEVAHHHRNLEEVVEKFTAISNKVYFIPGNVS